MPQAQLITRRECADLLRVSPLTVSNYVAQRAMPCIKIGKTFRFEPEKVLEWAREYEVNATKGD